MIETIEEPVSTRSAADRAADRNWTANSQALKAMQPKLLDEDQFLPTDVEWIFARDGSLTALDLAGQWWKGCSLPSRSAEFMLRKAELDGTVLCFLHPTHAAQLRRALDRMTPGQALLALTPDWQTLLMILACEDFSADISAHRLYFAAGEQWEALIDQLLTGLPGLPTPTQFIRPIMADSAPADAFIAPAQKIFAEHSNRRAQNVRILRENWKSATIFRREFSDRRITGVSPVHFCGENTGETPVIRDSQIARICLVAPANFRLWDDTGESLVRAMADVPDNISISRFNSDDPASASSAALAMAAAQCDAIVMPNMGRADLPDLMPDAMPWATWLTSPRIPSADKAGPNDTLLVADANWKTLAVEKGWRPDRVFIAEWPPRECSRHLDDSHLPGVFRTESKPALAIIADTATLDPPNRVTQYSSHRLLWESIRDELLNDPFSLGGSAPIQTSKNPGLPASASKDFGGNPDEFSADVYLAERMRKARIEDEGFDRPAFLDGVILHAWQQGLARMLLRERLPLKLFGAGWENLEEFQDCAARLVGSREQLDRAVRSAVALIHAWPKPGAHPIEAMGKPVIRAGRRHEAFVRDAKLAVNGKLLATKQSQDLLAGTTILRALSVRSA